MQKCSFERVHTLPLNRVVVTGVGVEVVVV